MHLLITSFYNESVAAENFGEENQMEPLRLPMPPYCNRVSINPQIKFCQVFTGYLSAKKMTNFAD